MSYERAENACGNRKDVLIKFYTQSSLKSLSCFILLIYSAELLNKKNFLKKKKQEKECETSKDTNLLCPHVCMILRLFSNVRLLRNLNDKLTSFSLLLLAAKNDFLFVHFSFDS